MSRSKASRQKEMQLKQRARQKRLERQTAIRESAVRPSGRLKMSEVIEHLAEPLIDDFGDTPEDVERVIMMTIVGWNLSLFPPEDREEHAADLFQQFFGADPEARHAVQWVLDLVIERKQKYYPNLRNLIVDVRFDREPDDTVYFEVAYEVEPFQSP